MYLGMQLTPVKLFLPCFSFKWLKILDVFTGFNPETSENSFQARSITPPPPFRILKILKIFIQTSSSRRLINWKLKMAATIKLTWIHGDQFSWIDIFYRSMGMQLHDKWIILYCIICSEWYLFKVLIYFMIND